MWCQDLSPDTTVSRKRFQAFVYGIYLRVRIHLSMGLRNRTNLIHYNCFFVTTTCYRFLPLLASDEAKKIITESITFCNKKYKASIVAYALMPEHIHLIIYFNEENKLSDYMRDLKKFTSVAIRNHVIAENQKYQRLLRYELDGQKLKVWKDRFDDLVLYSRKVTLIKLHYINNNPIKAGLCEKVEDYEYCSAGYYKTGKRGLIDVLHVEEIL